MLDQITNLIKEAAGGVVNQHPGVPDKDKAGVTNEAVSSFSQTFEQITAGGDFQQLVGMFSGDNNAKGAIANQFSGNFINNITKKFGLDAGVAQSLATSLLPVIVEKLKGMFGGGGMDLGGLMGGAMGGMFGKK
jgi:uncharacterized protein YidB (DUF937 family)